MSAFLCVDAWVRVVTFVDLSKVCRGLERKSVCGERTVACPWRYGYLTAVLCVAHNHPPETERIMIGVMVMMFLG